MELVPTGIAAVLLTGASRVLEALIRKNRFLRRPHVDDEAFRLRVDSMERKMERISQKTSAADLDYRVHAIEIEAARHGWKSITPRGGDND